MINFKIVWFLLIGGPANCQPMREVSGKSSPLRIAVCGFHCENCTFSPLASAAADFEVLRGRKLLEAYPFHADFSNAELIPLVRARALPGGTVERAFYDGLKSECVQSLKDGGPWDGVYVDIHGAANVQGLDDAEADFVGAIRAVAGPRCLIAASYDLHGNLSARLMEIIDIITAYRTAPHRDWMETEERACRLLVECLRSGIRPLKVYYRLPILLTGEQTSTEWEPGASLYGLISEVVSGPVLDASINVGYAWADEPRVGASVVALGVEPQAVRSAAMKLARRFWEVRRDFAFGVRAGDLDECVRIVRETGRHQVVISDSGDNITAGAPGDLPLALKAIMDAKVPDAIVSGIPDPEAVSRCQRAGVGQRVNLSVGAKLDACHGRPLEISGVVESLWNPFWEFDTHTTTMRNPTAVVRVGGVRLILTHRRTPFFTLRDFRQLGLEPARAALLVVKLGYLTKELNDLPALSLLALTPGAVDQNLDRLPYRRLQKPIFPLDPDTQWHV